MSENQILMIVALAIPAYIIFASTVFYGLFLRPLFAKVGEKTADAFIPLLNLYRATQVACLPGWLFFACLFIPSGVLIWRALVGYKLAKAFDCNDTEAALCMLFGLMFLPMVFLIFGAGKNEYLPNLQEKAARERGKGFSAEDKTKRRKKK